MTERRVLPERSNRGKRPPPTEEDKEKEDAVYSQLFEKAQQNLLESSRNEKEKELTKTNIAQIEFERKQIANPNRLLFPFSRGYHYFFDLLTFPRLESNFSYAIDDKNIFGSTFSQENKVICDGLTVGELFNRIYFGLPQNDGHFEATKDKNICHSFLFANEDRKYQSDRQLYELRQILKNLDFLEKSGKIKQFSCFQKDVDLMEILEDDLTEEEKKTILRKKIKTLAEKKEIMKPINIQEDKKFFLHSLNQKLHNQIESLKTIISFEYILKEISYKETLRTNLEGLENIEESNLSPFFKYYQSESECITKKSLEEIQKRLKPQFFSKDSEDNYKITIPFVFFSFANTSLMKICENILALRLANQNEASFFLCKAFWKRIFGKDLEIKKEMKVLSKQEFDKSMNTVLVQLSKWKKQEEKLRERETFKYPELDSLLILDSLDENSNMKDLFPREKEVSINAREYVCLAIFHNLYICLFEIYEFIKNNDIMMTLISSEFYTKAHNQVIQIFGTARMGLMDKILKKLSEVIVQPDFETEHNLKWVYNEELEIAYIIRMATKETTICQNSNNYEEFEEQTKRKK